MAAAPTRRSVHGPVYLRRALKPSENVPVIADTVMAEPSPLIAQCVPPQPPVVRPVTPPDESDRPGCVPSCDEDKIEACTRTFQSLAILEDSTAANPKHTLH